MSAKRIVAFFVGLALSGVFLYLAFRGVNLGEFASELNKVNVPILLLSEVTKLGVFLITAFRARLLLSHLYPYSFARLFKAQLFLFAANNVLPFRLGELVRVHYLAIHGQQAHSSCIAVAALERLLDACALILFLFVLIAFADRLPLSGSIYIIICGATGGTLLAMIIGHFPGQVVSVVDRLIRPLGRTINGFIMPKVELFAQGLGSLASLPRTAGVSLASVATWLTQMGTVQIWIWAWGLSLPWYAPLTVLLFLVVGTAIPSAPGFIGTYHYFGAAALHRFGVSRAAAVSFAVVGHVMALGPFTIIALALAFREYLRGELFSLEALRGLNHDS